MLDYLDTLGTELEKRRETLEKNIASASNSFYDSYRSLCECFIKLVLSHFNVCYEDNDTVGKLIERPAVKETLTEKAGIKEEDRRKIKSYILKINGHVHKHEKLIDEVRVHDYMSALYRFTAPFSTMLGCSPEEPTYYETQRLFGSAEKELYYTKMKAAISDELSKRRYDDLQNDIKEQIASFSDRLDKMESGTARGRQTVKNSSNEWIEYSVYYKRPEHFLKSKLLILALSVAFIIVAVMRTRFCFNTDTVKGLALFYGLLQHIFSVLVVVIMLKTITVKQTSFTKDIDGVGILDEYFTTKKKYKIGLIILMIEALVDIFSILVPDDTSEQLSKNDYLYQSYSAPIPAAEAAVYVTLTVLSVALAIAVFFIARHFYGHYYIVSLWVKLGRARIGPPEFAYTISGTYDVMTEEELMRRFNLSIPPKKPWEH